MRRWGPWVVDDHDVLSLHGVSMFPLLTNEGRLLKGFVQYRLVDADNNIVEAEEHFTED